MIVAGRGAWRGLTVVGVGSQFGSRISLALVTCCRSSRSR